jgi:type VI secretion system protein ImpM
MMAPRAILFGKLPSHGDFVDRGMVADRRAAWDGWLSGALDQAAQRLGDGFAAAHDAASPWRFVSGPGPLGGDWRAGALAASIDAVGRRFFIVLAADGLTSSQAAARGQRLAETLEDLIYSAFEAKWIADAALDAARGAIAEILAGDLDETGEPQERWWTHPGPDGAPVVLAAAPADLIGEAARGRIEA